MSERDGSFFEQGESEEGGSWAQMFVLYEQLVIRADGKSYVEGVAVVGGTDDEVVQQAVDSFARERGVDVRNFRKFSEKGVGLGNGSGIHYFSSSTWKAPWQPKGSKPNWRVGPPSDPSLN